MATDGLSLDTWYTLYQVSCRARMLIIIHDSLAELQKAQLPAAEHFSVFIGHRFKSFHCFALLSDLQTLRSPLISHQTSPSLRSAALISSISNFFWTWASLFPAGHDRWLPEQGLWLRLFLFTGGSNKSSDRNEREDCCNQTTVRGSGSAQGGA